MTTAQATAEVAELHRKVENTDASAATLQSAVTRSAAVIQAFFAAEFRATPLELSVEDKAVRLPGSKIRWQHVMWCCRRIPELFESGETEKAVRWLGFVQGSAWASNMVSISQLALLWPDDAASWSAVLHPERPAAENVKRAARAAHLVRDAVRAKAPDIEAAELSVIGKLSHSPPRPAKHAHVLWCCDAIPEMASPVKAHLWLGFVQGVAWTFGYASIDELRESMTL
jgi:hypothetical protein